jgi:hypothetical protein
VKTGFHSAGGPDEDTREDRGGYASGTAFVAGLAPAVWVGAAAVAVAAAAALFLPRLRRTAAAESGAVESGAVPAGIAAELDLASK